MPTMPTDDLGLTTCFQTPDTPIWSDELFPALEQRALLRFAWDELLNERYHSALDRLMAVTDNAYAKSPSFAMRRFYYMGLAQQLLAESNEPDTAVESSARWLRGALRDYKRALDIAVSPIEWPADASARLTELSEGRPATGAEQVVISRRMADCLHDMLRFEQALSCYRTAFAALDRYQPGDEVAIASAAIRLHNFIARAEMTVSHYQYALDNLVRADELRARYGARVTTQWDRATADWLRAIIWRAQSQQCGGDLSLLRDGLRLFKAVERRLVDDPDHMDSVRRLYIQLAETHLDLAEYYRAQNRHAAFKANLKRAAVYGIQAADALRDVKDPHGKFMVELALARLEHLSIQPYQLSAALDYPNGRDKHSRDDQMDLSPRIAAVENGAKALKDDMLMARAKTLRGDVLVSLGELVDAILTYHEALGLFEQAAARGESTRAVYGLRRAMEIL